MICNAIKCMFNNNEKCSIEEFITLDKNGKCEGVENSLAIKLSYNDLELMMHKEKAYKFFTDFITEERNNDE